MLRQKNCLRIERVYQFSYYSITNGHRLQLENTPVYHVTAFCGQKSGTEWLGSMFRILLADIKVLAICNPIWRLDQGEICCKPLLVVGRNSFPVALRLRSLLSCKPLTKDLFHLFEATLDPCPVVPLISGTENISCIRSLLRFKSL